MGPMLRRGQSKVQNKQLKDQAAFPRVGRGGQGQDRRVLFQHPAGARMKGAAGGHHGECEEWKEGEGGVRSAAVTQGRTYKLLPSTFLLVAPRKLIRMGSECSSPTMVGPTSCGERQQSG